MLVVCPECGAEISQYSETCVKCGFPLKNFMDDNGLNDFEHVKICPKCGCTNSSAYPQDGVPIRLKCKKCGTNLVQTDIPCERFGKILHLKQNVNTWLKLQINTAGTNSSKRCMMSGLQNFMHHPKDLLPNLNPINHTVHTVIQPILLKCPVRAVSPAH